MDDQYLVRRGGKHFARTTRIADAVTDAHDTRRQVQLTSIVNCPILPGEREVQIAQCLIHRLALGNAKHILIFQSFCFARFILKEQFPDLRQSFQGIGIEVNASFLAVPNRIFVQLDTLHSNAAKRHAAESAITDWQRIAPPLRRVLVPENRIGGEEWSGCDEE